jgi:hypothetical protein
LNISLQLYDKGAVAVVQIRTWMEPNQLCFRSHPDNTGHTDGNLGQFAVVIPEEEFVVVRLGLTRNESQANTNWLLANLLERIP